MKKTDALQGFLGLSLVIVIMVWTFMFLLDIDRVLKDPQGNKVACDIQGHLFPIDSEKCQEVLDNRYLIDPAPFRGTCTDTECVRDSE